jgi:type I site-specific restriction-modification system R (restriction) subunit
MEQTIKSISKTTNDDTNLIVTTIQKLKNAKTRGRYQERMERSKRQKMVFIFDECHRNSIWRKHTKELKTSSKYSNVWIHRDIQYLQIMR